jgi:hypothetical protein
VGTHVVVFLSGVSLLASCDTANVPQIARDNEEVANSVPSSLITALVNGFDENPRDHLCLTALQRLMVVRSSRCLPAVPLLVLVSIMLCWCSRSSSLRRSHSLTAL